MRGTERGNQCRLIADAILHRADCRAHLRQPHGNAVANPGGSPSDHCNLAFERKKLRRAVFQRHMRNTKTT